MAKISELHEGMSNVELTANVVGLSEVRDVNTRFGPNRVCDVTIQDDSGSVKLTLWGDDIDKVKEGDSVSITGAYVKSWRGEMQVSVTRNGKLDVSPAGLAVEQTAATEAEPEAEEEAKPEAEEEAKPEAEAKPKKKEKKE